MTETTTAADSEDARSFPGDAPPGEPPPLDPSEIVRQGDKAARVLFIGAPILGAIGGFQALLERGAQGPSSPEQWMLGLLDGLFLAGLWTLAGWVASPLLRAFGRALAIRAARPPVQPAAAIPAASALPLQAESSARGLTVGSAVERLRDQTVVEIRRALRAGKWDEASDRLEAMAQDDADETLTADLRQELRAAREAAREELLAKLDAARTVNDPDRVLELHQGLVPLMEPESRAPFEGELSAWFLRVIHNRLRTGRIQPDLALLAGRVADALSHTVGGASLRASLPTLRRSAGLCPRCAQPYTGVADACPACLLQAQLPAVPSIVTAE